MSGLSTLSLVSVLSLIFLSEVQVKAQDVATITGVVTDQRGAVVVGVEITLENPQTSVTYKTVTNSSGSYTITPVKPGPGYKIEFVHAGFRSVVVSGLYLNVDATRVQNAQLSVGGTRESVDVSAASDDVTLNTTDATVGNNFQVQLLNDLPIQDRSNPSALFTQQPGVTLAGAVTGARVDQSRVTLDGLDVNDMATGCFGCIVANAPVDSVQEFRGVTAGFLPSAAGGGGGQYELVTRSGTNAFHGALVEYHRDTAMEANDWFNNNAVPQVPRPPLIRNQFGGNLGGPILKNELFFFFDYNGRRDTVPNIAERTVPLDSFRNGTIQYVNSSNNVGALNQSASPGVQSVQSLDPQGVGFNTSLLALFSSRYPHANDLASGDQLNTGGFRFNAPSTYKEDDFVQKIDFRLNGKMSLFGKGNFTRRNNTYGSIQFPGDPETYPHTDQSYSWVVGHIWTISNSVINQVSYGEVVESLNWPVAYNPTGATQYVTFGGNGTGGAILTGPYASAWNAQGRSYPIPEIREDFNWQKGKHSLQFGGTFKYITPNEYSILNFNTPTIGLGGYTPGLDSSLRPNDIGGGSATALYDSAFALALAPYTALSATFNYDAQGNALPQGSGAVHQYRYYETELYFGDRWKLLPSLALTYGLRWQNYSVPYDTHGLQSIENFTFDNYLTKRVAQSAAGQSGNLSVPLLDYNLGGRANHAPGYYKPQYLNFGPRLALAYSVNPRTVLNAGASILYDQTVVNAVQYQQSQFSYLFQAAVTKPLGVPNDPTTSLKNDSRFSGVNNPPPVPVAPNITKPFFPFVSGSGSSAVPNGLANGFAFNEIIDPNLKNPYYIQFSLGLEHQLAREYILKARYVGREGRRLLAQADAEQLIDFRDPLSGQKMSDAFASISRQLRAGVNARSVTAQPWYENVLPLGYGASIGFPSNTSLITYFLGTYIQRGDFADSTQALSGAGLLPPNVGMASQFSENTFYTNKGSSSYNGLLVTVHKNAGYGLQFDLNYTWSHSIDNVSLIANAPAFAGYGFICDVLRPRECRGNSDFDLTHYLNGNFIYELPVGRGKAFGAEVPRWLDEIIAGWLVSGLPNWHSGNAYFASSNAFVAGYSNDAPAVLTGPISDLNIHFHGGHGQPLYGYTNPTRANADFTGPLGFAIGSRNNLRGPRFFNLDLGLGKAFPIFPEKVLLKFRMDAFNVFNHPSFGSPSTDITDSSLPFGEITGTTSTARALQGSLRLEF